MGLAKIEVQKLAEESGWQEGDEPWEYHDLTKAQKNIIRSRNPRIDELLKEHNDSISIKPMTSDEEEERTEVYSAWDTLSRMKKNQLESMKVIDEFGNEQDAFQMINQEIRDTDGELIFYSGENYRDQVNQIFSDMRVRYDDINEKYPLGIDKINSDMETKIRNGRINDFDAIYHKYINDVVGQNYDRANGEFNYKFRCIQKYIWPCNCCFRGFHSFYVLLCAHYGYFITERSEHITNDVPLVDWVMQLSRKGTCLSIFGTLEIKLAS